MSSHPTITDFIRQASNFVSYAAYLHLERYGLAYGMAPEASQASKERVHWTDEETFALVDYLNSKKYKNENAGASFSKQTFQGAIIHLQPFYKQGGPKDVTSVKEKFNKVSLIE